MFQLIDFERSLLDPMDSSDRQGYALLSWGFLFATLQKAMRGGASRRSAD